MTRELVDSLFSDSEPHDLYLGVIETVEGTLRDFPEGAWKRKLLGDPEIDKKIDEAAYGAGLMALGVDESILRNGWCKKAKTLFYFSLYLAHQLFHRIVHHIHLTITDENHI